MNELIDILHREQCSLVVKNHGIITTYNKPGVRDLEHLLDHEPDRLKGAMVADKIIGKAAAAMEAVGGVKMLYAEVMSERAIPFLKEAGIAFSYGALVEAIQEQGDRCQLESITQPAESAEEAVALLRAHFAEMQARRQQAKE